MFFEKLSEIPQIAARTSCTIFVVPPDTQLNLPTPIYVRPSEDKATRIISIEQIRDLLAQTNNRETSERFFVIAPANTMNEAAQNAFLKTFEEPKTHCHFVLLTEQPNLLLPTIRSRAEIFFPRRTGQLDQAPQASAKILSEAKRLIAATPIDLPAIAAELAKVKTRPRKQALEIVGTAIELLYKSYLKTNNTKFLSKIPNFLKLYDALSENGHIKLHIVADLC